MTLFIFHRWTVYVAEETPLPITIYHTYTVLIRQKSDKRLIRQIFSGFLNFYYFRFIMIINTMKQHI